MRYVQQLYDEATGATFDIAIDFKKRVLDFCGKTQKLKTDEALGAAYHEQMAALLAANPRLRDTSNARAYALDLSALRKDLAEPPPRLPKRPIGIREAKDASGLSKIGGDPDLPAHLAWPGQRLFVAQLCCEEIASEFLPARGMLYYFIAPDCTDNVALYAAEGPYARRAGPSGLPTHYAHELRERHIVFGKGSQDDGDRLFGSPDGELEWDVFHSDDDDGPPATRYQGQLVLALQLCFDDGFLYLGVPPHDLRAGDLSRARAVYWGT